MYCDALNLETRESYAVMLDASSIPAARIQSLLQKFVKILITFRCPFTDVSL